MPGSAYFDPPSVPLTGVGSVFVAARYDREAGTIDALPNLQVLEVDLVEGPTPATARFAYVFDSSDPSSPFPTQAEQLWKLGGRNPYVVLMDDEILIYEHLADGTRLLVFDGFAQVPQLDIGGEGQAATFVAVGVAIRLWDYPVEGASYRQSDDPEDGDTVPTGLPTHFNPGGEGNRTKEGHADDDGEDTEHHAFLDANLPKGLREVWTLDSFVAYLLWQYNADEEYVRNPSSQDIKDYLLAVTPKEGFQFFDVADPDTYDTEPIVLSSYDCTNKLPIDCLAEQLHYYGFELFFEIVEDEDGLPITLLNLYRKDGFDEVAPKELFSPAAGWDLTKGLPDLDSLSLARDVHEFVNEVAIETAPVEYEVSVVLAPGFEIAASDADAGNIANYDQSKLAAATAQLRHAYRRFVLDEAGTGHWDFDEAEWVTEHATSLDAILGPPEAAEGAEPDAPKVPRYVNRPRPGLSKLVTADDEETAFKAELAISRDYEGKSPAVWDKTGTWRSLARHGWRLLDDQLGIEIVADSPESWHIPADPADTQAAKGDVVRVITSMANPSAGGDKNTARFFLRLTCKIQGDWPIAEAVAEKRDASPSLFTIRRRVDSKDHFRKQVVDSSSKNNDEDPPAATTGRDDTDAAKAKAESLRGANEFPPISLEIRIPWITHAIGIGDFVSKINGRDIDLLLNDGAGAGESPKYPVVTGLSWHCQEPQATIVRFGAGFAEPEQASAERG